MKFNDMRMMSNISEDGYFSFQGFYVGNFGFENALAGQWFSCTTARTFSNYAEGTLSDNLMEFVSNNYNRESEKIDSKEKESL